MSAPKKQRLYRVGAQVTISMYTEVKASSKREARRLAMQHDMMTLCYSCSRGDPTSEWVTSGELDGVPQLLGPAETTEITGDDE